MKLKAHALALTLGLAAGGVAMTAQAQNTSGTLQQANPTSTFADVQADLADWRQAGFNDNIVFWLGQDAFSDVSQERMAEYKRLRQARAQAQN